MKPEENKILVRRFYEEAVFTGIVDKFDSFFSPEHTAIATDCKIKT